MTGRIRVFWDHKLQKVINTNDINVLLMGSRSSNDIVLPDRHVSAFHLVFFASEDKLVLLDLKSRNGTYVNGVRVEGRYEVKSGDLIQIGYTSILYLSEQESDT